MNKAGAICIILMLPFFRIETCFLKPVALEFLTNSTDGKYIHNFIEINLWIMNILTSKSHGVLDYIFSIFLLAAPTIFQMEGNLSTITYVLGAAHLLITILTNFELGLIKLIPFRIHGLIEIVVSLLLVALAFWFNSQGSEFGFYFYLALAGVIMIVFTITDFKSGSGKNYRN